MNPQAVSQYLPILGFDESLADASEVLQGLYNTCALAGYPKCSIAAQYPTPEAIKGAVDQLLETAYKNWNDPTGYSYNVLIDWELYPALSWPTNWDFIFSSLSFDANVSLSGPPTMTHAKRERLYSSPLTRHSHRGPLYRSGLKPNGLSKRQQQIVGSPVVGYSWQMVYTAVYYQFVFSHYIHILKCLYTYL
jgi:hypothetical protein